MGNRSVSSVSGVGIYLDHIGGRHQTFAEMVVEVGAEATFKWMSVVQMAAKIVIEPIFEADFQPFSYGFRPRKSATQAL